MNGASAKIGIGLQLEQVAFSYGNNSLTDDNGFAYDLSVAPGEIVAVAGPSGSGKSTLLNLIAGFEIPSAGRILAGGTDITCLPPGDRPVSMLFQENNLFGHLSVKDNVLLGVAPNLRATKEQIDAARQALAKTGLEGKEMRLPAELSGGERQRAALARALIRRRPILLLDEPFASLGPALRRQMLELVRSLHAETAMTILFVSHHPEDLVEFADSYFFLFNGTVGARGRAAEMTGAGAPEIVRAYLANDSDRK
jgi:thiamine transport system ATP-binding protein